MSVYAFGGQSYRRPHYGLGQSITFDKEVLTEKLISTTINLMIMRGDVVNDIFVNAVLMTKEEAQESFDKLDYLEDQIRANVKDLVRLGAISFTSDGWVEQPDLMRFNEIKENYENDRIGLVNSVRHLFPEDVEVLPPANGGARPKPKDSALYAWLAVGAMVAVGAYFILRRPR